MKCILPLLIALSIPATGFAETYACTSLSNKNPLSVTVDRRTKTLRIEQQSDTGHIACVHEFKDGRTGRVLIDQTEEDCALFADNESAHQSVMFAGSTKIIIVFEGGEITFDTGHGILTGFGGDLAYCHRQR